MDEILYAPPAGGTTAVTSSSTQTEKKGATLSHYIEVAGAVARGLCRQGARIVSHGENHLKYLINPASFLAFSALIGVAAVVSTMYTPSYSVTIDGVTLGTVRNPQVLTRVIERVEDRASEILGYDYVLDTQVSYDSALAHHNTFSPVSTFETYLFDQIDAIDRNYVLSVDGNEIGVASEKNALDNLLAEYSAPYITEDTVEVGFTSEVIVAQQYTPADISKDLAATAATLAQNTNGETVYEVQKGDTFMAIAYANDMTTSELQTLNPDVNINKLSIGQLLNVKETVPYLSVRTMDALTYEESIACPVEEVEDNSMYQGESKVLEAGVPGTALIAADVTYINGREQERNITSTTVLSEPTTRVVAVGTMVRPSWYPNGYFIWPTSGRVTSEFGYRSIFGSYSYHSGMDIASSYGTAIKASDGGTVIFAGYKGSYGNLVIIDHGNGYQTYYAHNSSMLVSTGEKVYQGQTIAKMGSTGRSSGNHCHFEVRVNGTAVNPRSYLS